MDVDLASSTIGAIREFIDSQSSRADLKSLALSAGAKAGRVMKIKISGNMSDPGYKSKAQLMGEIIDTVYEDFEKPEADGILLRIVRDLVVTRETWIPTEEIAKLERGLAASNLSMVQVTGSTAAVALLETTAEQTRASDLKEATDLLTKALLRLSTDKPGAITACTSACESTCRIALERLDLPLPARKQLPDYLDSLCDQTNIMDLARVSGEETRKIFGSLRGLARHSYQAAHELGDRHAQGDRASDPTAIAADLAVVSCAALGRHGMGDCRHGGGLHQRCRMFAGAGNQPGEWPITPPRLHAPKPHITGSSTVVSR